MLRVEFLSLVVLMCGRPVGLGKEQESQQVVMHSVCLVSGREDYTGMAQILLYTSNKNMVVIIMLSSCRVID